jgi:hypothetical protein
MVSLELDLFLDYERGTCNLSYLKWCSGWPARISNTLWTNGKLFSLEIQNGKLPSYWWQGLALAPIPGSLP